MARGGGDIAPGLMNIPDSGVRAGPVLLVRPTGGGKSSVRDVHAIMNSGVFFAYHHASSIVGSRPRRETVESSEEDAIETAAVPSSPRC
jgi:hypothetical protein